MPTNLRQLGGYALTMDRRPIALRQLGGYAVVGDPPKIAMAKTGIELLRDMINSISSEVWTPSTLEVSAPSPSSVGNRNTSVDVSPKGSAEYIGQYTLHYRRVDFSRLFTGEDLLPALSPVSTMAGALNQINTRYLTKLTEADVVAQSFSGQTKVTLTAADGSYILLPGTQVTIGT